MTKENKLTKAEEDLLQKLGETTEDLQRTRADFENYRKRVEVEKVQARENGRISTIVKLLPTIDNIERAIEHIPADLAENAWAQGIATLAKNLEKALGDIGVTRIDAKPGAPFNPDLHNAVQFDEDSVGENEIVAAELQSGYMLDGQPIREAMVKVTRQ